MALALVGFDMGFRVSRSQCWQIACILAHHEVTSQMEEWVPKVAQHVHELSLIHI